MRIAVQLGVAAIRRASSLDIAPKDVDDAVLDFLRDFGEVHVFTATGGALDLEVIAVILVKPLQTLDEQEIDSKP